MERKMARPRGSGYQNVDRPLVDEMRAMLLNRTAASWYAAALLCAARAHGRGDFEAKRRRLVNLAIQIYGRVSPNGNISSISRPSESTPARDSVPGMKIEPERTADIETEAVLDEMWKYVEAVDRENEALRLRNAVQENQIDRLLDTVERRIPLLEAFLEDSTVGTQDEPTLTRRRRKCTRRRTTTK